MTIMGASEEQQLLLGKIIECIESARKIPMNRNMALVITNLENAEDKLRRVVRGD